MTAITLEMQAAMWESNWKLAMAQCAELQNIVEVAKQAISAVGHKPACSFSACNCGSVETFKDLRLEFWRKVQKAEAWPPAPGEGL